eukprot:CAMPEP_0118721284 /NCGR_PEP_ID=MMETSP0800-20121206/30629_1 /TAXON_ID=210618 ORGANISM="Striatella unipunctata, Strain CCMP2910" /NCGR_SAMPLE_ID=MMETSP0800 /ASSEMBLY_ACC=CAM_ASM_000638 /LENGTH=50 /DNA_ID=CAMNT_0006629115 /DNA_START=549 /DNA_END=698 /DNA_ORIENTATION=-
MSLWMKVFSTHLIDADDESLDHGKGSFLAAKASNRRLVKAASMSTSTRSL